MLGGEDDGGWWWFGMRVKVGEGDWEEIERDTCSKTGGHEQGD